MTDLGLTRYTSDEKEALTDARIGTYFIIPLRTTLKQISSFRLNDYETSLRNAHWIPYNWQYDDLYSQINRIFTRPDPKETTGKQTANVVDSIGLSYQLPLDSMISHLCPDHSVPLASDSYCFVSDRDSENSKTDQRYAEFQFRCVQILILHSGIGFLVIGIESSDPNAYDELKHSGFNENRCNLGVIVHNGSGQKRVVDGQLDFGTFVRSLLHPIGMTDFSGCIESGRMDQLLRDATVYSVAVLNTQIIRDTKEEMDSILCALCLNVRQGQKLGSPTFYEPDTQAYTLLAAPSIEEGGSRQWLRWGIYTTFEHTTQVIFNDIHKSKQKIDPINVNSKKREDNYLPFLLLALYARYSYLFFTEQLGTTINSNRPDIDWLERQMLCLKASGTFMASDMTPYDNINVFLRYQYALYEIVESQKLIDNKINIILHQKDAKAEKRNQYLERFLTIFGIASILCDSIGLLDSLIELSEYQNIIHWCVFAAECCAFTAFLIVMRILERKE